MAALAWHYTARSLADRQLLSPHCVVMPARAAVRAVRCKLALPLSRRVLHPPSPQVVVQCDSLAQAYKELGDICGVDHRPLEKLGAVSVPNRTPSLPARDASRTLSRTSPGRRSAGRAMPVEMWQYPHTPLAPPVELCLLDTGAVLSEGVARTAPAVRHERVTLAVGLPHAVVIWVEHSMLGGAGSELDVVSSGARRADGTEPQPHCKQSVHLLPHSTTEAVRLLQERDITAVLELAFSLEPNERAREEYTIDVMVVAEVS